MEIPASTYLFNLSIVAMSFAAISVLVTLIRQLMGGKLSNFDIHQIASYVGAAFALTIATVLPSLVAPFGSATLSVWSLSSVLAALLLAASNISVLAQRRRIDPAWRSMSLPQMAAFGSTVLVVLLLVANALVPAIQGAAIFQVAVTLEMAVLMWTFVRRVSSLLGDRPGEDWDPTRG